MRKVRMSSKHPWRHEEVALSIPPKRVRHVVTSFGLLLPPAHGIPLRGRRDPAPALRGGGSCAGRGWR